MESNKEKNHLFGSFCINPKINFDTQEPGEIPILVLRAHPLTQIGWFINGIFFLIIIYLSNFFVKDFLNLKQTIFFNLFFIGLVLSYWWLNFLGWYFNVGVVSNRKIVDIDYHGVLYKEVTGTKLSNIEDITAKTAGYFGSIFDYGNVFIQTAGTEVNIEFIKVPKPTQVVTVINHLIGQGNHVRDRKNN